MYKTALWKSVVSTSQAVICKSESHSVTSVSMSIIEAIQQVAALAGQSDLSVSQVVKSDMQ